MWRYSILIGLLVLAIGANGYTFYPSVQQTYHYYATPKTWVDARDTCINDGANLALPRNAAEMQVLVNIYNQNTPLPSVTYKDYILLNFHDQFREGEYVTDKGRALQYYFLKWGSGNPDNYGGNENCGSFYKTGVLNDFSCNTPSPFICQKNKPEIFTPDFRCKTKDSEYKYSPQTKRCYKLHLNPRPWPEARAICEAEGGNLAIINSKKEESVLSKILTNTPDDKFARLDLKNFALLGFHDIFQEGKFVTVEGKDLQSTGYVNWATNEPNNVGNEDCGSMYKTGILNDVSCNTPLVFFCEIGSIYGKRAADGVASDEDNGLNHTDDEGNSPNINRRSLRNPS